MNPVVMTETMDTQGAPRHRLCKLVQYMLGLDARGFGGPMTLVGVQVVFDGVRAAVIGIIEVIAVVAKSACKLTTRNIDRVRLLWVNLLVSAALTAITNSKFVWALLGAVSFVFGSDLAIVTVFVLWRFKKTPEPLVVVMAALIGLVVYLLMNHARLRASRRTAWTSRPSR